MQKFSNNRKKYFPTVEDIEFSVESFKKCRVLCRGHSWDLPEKAKLFAGAQYEVGLVINACTSPELNPVILLPLTMTCHILTSNYSPFQVAYFQELRDSLHRTKCQLNTFKREEWRLHTKKRNLIANLMYTIRSNNTAELFIQSWPKLWEILHKFDMIPPGIDHLKTIHLCEAPGSFVSSLNHYLKQNRPEVALDWVATSLNPYFEDIDPAQVINDDRLIRHTLDKWEFGPDNSGNLFDPALVDQLKRRTEGGPVNLVTADGSQDNIQSNELVVVDLLLAEALTALKVLSKGGHYVQKIFTVLECPTINMVYLLCLAFDEVHLFKPVSSREASSEMYLVCKGYRYGREDAAFQDYLQTIDDLRKDESRKGLSMFPFECIAKEFQKDILDAMRYFVSMQEEVINANISSFPINIYVHEWNTRKFIREEIERRFLKAYPLKELPHHDRLCAGAEVEDQLEKFEIDNSFLGSWEEENEIKVKMSNEELKMQLREEFQIVKYSFEWPYVEYEVVIQWTGEDNDKVPLNIVRGAKIHNIRNSRFITKRLLNFFHKVLELDFGDLPTDVQVQEVGGKVLITMPIAGIKRSLREHENAFVEKLLINLKKVKGNSDPIDLVFRNILLIGQRSVAVVYLLSRMLKGTETTIKLAIGGEMIISKVTESVAGKLIQELETLYPLLQDQTVHSFVDIRRLRSNQPDAFYDLIKIFNVYCCVKLCEKLFE